MKSQKIKHSIILFASLTVLFLLVIWGNSLLSMESSSDQSSFITSIIQRLFPGIDFDTLEHIIRKCAHFTEFACLGASAFGLTYAICGLDFRRAWSVTAFPVIGCLLAASTDEMIQIFTERGNSVLDVLLDFSGSLTAIAIFCVVLLIVGRVKGRGASPSDEDHFDEDLTDTADGEKSAEN